MFIFLLNANLYIRTEGFNPSLELTSHFEQLVEFLNPLISPGCQWIILTVQGIIFHLKCANCPSHSATSDTSTSHMVAVQGLPSHCLYIMLQLDSTFDQFVYIESFSTHPVQVVSSRSDSHWQPPVAPHDQTKRLSQACWALNRLSLFMMTRCNNN